MRISCHEHSDLQQHERLFDDWSEHYQRMSPGDFRGRVVRLRLAQMEVFEERLNIRVEQHFRGPQGSLAFCFDTSEDALYLVDGQTQNTWVTPEHYAEVSVVFGEACLAGIGEADRALLADRLLKPLRSANCRAFSRGLSERMAALLRGDGAGTPELLARELLDHCLLLAEDAIPGADGAMRRSRGNRRIVGRVLELVSAFPDEPFSAAELAKAAGVSVRQMQKSFLDHTGLPPTRWLRLRRLNGAHRELAAAGPGEATVAEVAMRWSFWHLGRFSQEYRWLFGECPSQTLQRAGRLGS